MRRDATVRALRCTRIGAISLLVVALALAPASLARGPREALWELTAKDLDDETGQIILPPLWKFHSGDDPSFAARGFDDGDWQETDTRLLAGERPGDWDGMGWFRLRFRVSHDLRGASLGLTLRQFGAAEIYLDGELVRGVGTVDARRAATRARIQRQPHFFGFDDRAIHVLAVRFANHEADAFEEAGKIGGFRAALGTANGEFESYAANLRSLSAYQAFFTGLFAAFALLHLLLWVFYRESGENLYFGLLSGTVALLSYLFFHGHFTEDPSFFHVYDRAMNGAWVLLSVCALRFVYCVYDRSPQWLRTVLAAALAMIALGWFFPMAAKPWIFVLLLATAAEMVRVVVVANVRRQAGARIVGLGILILAGGMTVGLLASSGALPSSIFTVFLIPFASVLALILTMSVYLSRRFAQANHDLREQLSEVRRLSDQKLEDEVARRLLEAENQRQAEELEEARKLQLSMLPRSLPALPDLAVAAGMFTATEVGGDYYDFDVAEDGTLTVALGDATGHGMKAGTLVTATKSLFKGLDGTAELPETLGRFGRALKRMNLQQLNMALMLARFKAGRMRLAAAGMPPALVHRAASGEVESVINEGMPLGSMADFPYRQSELDLASGDTVLLMSDGFPERLNGEDEMLGYDKVQQAFSKVASTEPQVIIDRLVADGEAWASGRPAADDTTFVVLKVR